MWKRIFAENGVKNAVTLFHQANNEKSTRVLTLLKQAHGNAATTATEDQASSHDHHSAAQHKDFELDITEKPPTSDQLRSILEYVGDKKIGSVVKGSSNEEDAQRRLRADAKAFVRPLTVDWNGGKVVIGDNQTELSDMIKGLKSK